MAIYIFCYYNELGRAERLLVRSFIVRDRDALEMLFC